MADTKLIDADCPLILFPVRLETRFFRNELWIRVYPDNLHIDTFEPELTADEVQWGRHFYELLWRAADDELRRKIAWGQLAGRFGPARAAWVAGQLTPVNDNDRPRVALPDSTPLERPPQFPDPPTRPESAANETWTRAPWTRVLPDRWVANAFINGRPIASATGQNIPDPLAVGPDPQVSVPEEPDTSPVDEGIKWMIDFAEAEKVGMALRLSLPPIAGSTQRGIDRLIVVGVKASLDATASAKRVAELVRAHQYTDGLGLLAQGTPSNNTEDSPSAFASNDPGFEKSARWVLSGPRFQQGDGSDGDELCKAFGIPIDGFAQAPGAESREQLDARWMNRALWPATWGYYLEQMMHGIFPDGDIDADLAWGREHFVNHVRAGGPLPSLRIGKQPYGLLPVTSLAAWGSAPGEQSDPPKDFGLVSFLRRQQPIWLGASAAAPRMGRSNDPDKDFLEIFSMDALSGNYVARNVMGEKYAWHLLGFLNMFPLEGRSNALFQRWHEQHVSLARASLDQAGLRPEAMASRLAMALHRQESDSLGFLSRVQVEPGEQLVFNYIDALARAPSLDAVVRHDSIPGLFSMLYLLLRHALLLEYAAAAARKLNLTPGQRLEEDQIGFSQLGNVETLLGRISRAGLQAGQAFTDPAEAHIKEFREALRHLQDLPVSRLDLLMRGTLDLSAHRLDAWITSFATKRLKHMRQKISAGVYIGGYGWLENLQPARSNEPIPAPPGENAPVVALANNPGFVHAPSLDHAATVAVLRSGHLSHAATGKQDLLAVDLSSERARLAQWLLDGVKAGQPLGALLGYRLERGLHENHPGLSLDRFIAPLRELAPLTTTRVDESGQTMESVAAGPVVDGLKLYRRWQAEPGFLRTTLRVVPAAQPAEFAAVEAELRTLAETVDAVSDALIAESVHQVVRGNTARAAATLDAIERGEAPPPELEVIRTPRSGSAFTHRVVVMCPGDLATPRWPGSASSPRAAAEPALNAWVARLLGNPSKVRCRIDRLDSATGGATTSELSFSELGLGPLDVLYASESTDELHQSELEQRILYHARQGMGDLPSGTLVRMNPNRDAAWPMTDLSWSEFMELAGAARHLVAGARALQAGDLSRDDATTDDSIDAGDMERRAAGAVAALRLATTTLRDALASTTATSPEKLREAMLAISFFGIPGAIPLSAGGDVQNDVSGLVFQAQALEKEASGRLDKIAANEGRLAAPELTLEARNDLHQQRMRVVFGDGFRVLPRFRAPNGADVNSALAASTQVQGGDPFAVITLHQRMTRVREAIARLDDALRYAEALGTEDRLTLEVAQIPHREHDRWVGLTATPEQPLAAGRLSLILHLAAPVDFTTSVTGLIIDEWVEVVPNATETTGVVFQSNQPDSCPPQAILLAVPPDPVVQNFWTGPVLAQVLLETMDLARMRAVTPDLLDELGQYLPALYFSLNPAGETISTGFLVPG